MGHIRLGTLPQSKKWQDVVGLLETNAPLDAIAEAAARASEYDLKRATDDPGFQFATGLLVRLPFLARAPGFEDVLADLRIGGDSLSSLPAFLAGLSNAIERDAFEVGYSSDISGLAKAALMETFADKLGERLPTLFESTPQELRKALAGYASGQEFARLSRAFFANLTYRSLDYFLSRELANHTGTDQRFTNDADRVAFERALKQHTVEASRIVEEFAGGWYGKTVWQKNRLDQQEIDRFTRYSFKKMRDELGRRRATA
jgi:hypothetical protein